MDDRFSGEWMRSTIVLLAQEIRPEYFRSKRWFGSKGREIQGYRVVEFALLQAEPELLGLLLLEISYAGAEPELYLLPLACAPVEHVPAAIKDQPEGAAFIMQTPQGEVWAYDAFAEDPICVALYRGMYEDREFRSREGKLVFHHVPGRMDTRDVRTIKRISTEQSNTSIVYNDKLILKAFRKLSAGLNPDFEVPYFLTTHTDFRYVPKVAGFVEYRPAGHPRAVGLRAADQTQAISLAVLQDFVVNQGDGYTNALNRVREYFARVLQFLSERPEYTAREQADQASRCGGTMQEAAHRLGTITGLMHNALASNTELPDFRPEPITGRDAERWEEGIADLIKQVIQAVEASLYGCPPDQQELLRRVAHNEPAFLEMIAGLNVLEQEGCHKIRYHGDYHLGQVLKTGDDFMVLDFEGEPARSLAERRAKHCPLKDVAGLLRSFNYAAYTVLFEVWQERPSDEDEKAELESWALAWENLARHAFLEGYCEATSRHTGPRFMPADPMAFQQVVKVFEVEKAFYELNYEFNSRPSWVPIPARGLLRNLYSRATSYEP